VTRLRSIGAWVLVVVGLLGLVVPILPGIPLLLGGVALLGREHPLVQAALRWLGRRRMPGFIRDQVGAMAPPADCATRARIPR
jgi:uncharacterized membrane protein YbaN (DUF454 family)